MTEDLYSSKPLLDRAKFPGQLAMIDRDEVEPVRRFHESNWQFANACDFPGDKDEDWRWVDMQGFPVDFIPAGQHSAIHITWQPDLAGMIETMPEKTIITTLQESQSHQPALWLDLAGKSLDLQTDKFSAMTAALAEQGVLIHIPKGMDVPGVILVQVDYGALSGSTFSHHIIHLEESASATIIIRLTGEASDEPALVSDLFEISLEANARLNLTEVQMLPNHIWQISHEKSTLADNASLRWNYVTLGAAKTKNFVTMDLDGRGANVIARGAYFASSSQHFDLDTQQNHDAPHTTSDLLFKGAAIGTGKSTWEGMITVDPIAQQTDGYQSNRNLILSDSAEINAIPGLEIYADDVKCSHGATVGSLNFDELFYLQCRGIPLAEARTMIVEGFFAGIIDDIPHEETRTMIGRLVSEKLTEE